MKTHIQRKHGGESKFSQAVDNRPNESNYRATTFKPYSNKSPYYDDFGDKHDDYFPFLEKMLVPMRKLKEFKQLWSELNPSSPMIDSLSILQEAIYTSSITPYSFSPNQRVEQPTNTPYSFSPNQRVEQPTNTPYSFSPNQRVEPPGSGNTLGYEAFVCDRCLRVDLHEALDSTHSRSIKLNHRCNEQVAIGSRLKEDFDKELMIRKQLLIECLAGIVTSTSQYEDKAKLIAVEVPGFGLELDEEIIDLDRGTRDIPSWAYDVAQTGQTMLDKGGLQEYLEIFGSTFGLFRLIIYEKIKLYFVYISNGLKPQHLTYIKRLFEPRIRTDFFSSSGVSDRPRSTKLSDMITFMRVGKVSIPIFKLSQMQFCQTANISAATICTQPESFCVAKKYGKI